MHRMTNIESKTLQPILTSYSASRNDALGACTLPRGNPGARWPAYTPVATFSNAPLPSQHPPQPLRYSTRTLPRGHRAHIHSPTHPPARTPLSPPPSLHPVPATEDDKSHTRPLVERDKCESTV